MVNMLGRILNVSSLWCISKEPAALSQGNKTRSHLLILTYSYSSEKKLTMPLILPKL